MTLPTTLLPQPRELVLLGARLPLPEKGVIVLAGEDEEDLHFSVRSLQQYLREKAGLEWDIKTDSEAFGFADGLFLKIRSGGDQHTQGYTLSISPDRIDVKAASANGIFYAVQTIKQLLTTYGRHLPALRCRDWPDYSQRGVMLDISRDKVPTMETLYDLVDILASWKINQLQLYNEHTFAYQNHQTVWANASPMTAEQICSLDTFCQERFIELVPNQNSFGHMHRWLMHDRYKHLAECPQGCDTAKGLFEQPFTLCPSDPGSLNLLRELYDEFLHNFSSEQFNVGCDETFDLGYGRSKALVEKVGVGRVYLDFLLKIHQEVNARGRTMQFWGDIIINHPELVSELPRDVFALEWGYEAEHPFADHGARFAKVGIPFYVCPGTSSWNTIAGRTDNALENLRNAAENGLKHGAVGYLNTDWGDNGHWQPLPVSYIGFGYGAALGWAYEANVDLDIGETISAHAFHDRKRIMGQLAYDLGNVYQSTGMLVPNSSFLFWILQLTPKEITARFDLKRDYLAPRLRETLERITAIMEPLSKARMERDDENLIQREFSWSAAMLRHACQRALWLMGEYPVDKLSQEMPYLLSEHKTIWHARNRPGGFEDSHARLQRMALDCDTISGV